MSIKNSFTVHILTFIDPNCKGVASRFTWRRGVSIDRLWPFFLKLVRVRKKLIRLLDHSFVVETTFHNEKFWYVEV